MPEYFHEGHRVRIAFLCARGCTLEEIMEDLETEDRQQIVQVMKVHNLDNGAGGAGRRTIPVRVGPKAVTALKKAAGERNMVGADRVQGLLQRLVEMVGDDPHLIDQILDDRKSAT